jgi:hypothetical protein
MNALEDLKFPLTNTAMFGKNKATFDSAYNYKIGVRSKHSDLAYCLVPENVESGLISLFQIESSENLADIFTKGLLHATLCNLRMPIVDEK